MKKWGLFLVLAMVALACNVPLEGVTSTPAQEDASPAPPPSADESAGSEATGVGVPSPMVAFEPMAPESCTLYVSPDGSDDNPGAQDQPWQTFQHAADSATPGSVICFRGGTYLLENTISMTASGTADAPITFAGYPAETVVLDGQGQVGGMMDIGQGVSYLRVSSLTLKGFGVWGISVEGNNHDIQLDLLDIGGGEAGVHFTVGDSGQEPQYGPVERVTLENSSIHDVLYTAVDCTPGPCNQMVFRGLEIYGAGITQEEFFGADGLGIERGRDIIVADCSIHDNGGDGIDLNSRDREGNVSGVLVQRNRVFANHLQGIKLWGGGRMENNIIWGQGINPVMIAAYPGVYEIANNTIAYNMWDAAYSARDYATTVAYPEEGDASPPVTLTLINNIFAFNSGPDLEGGATGIYLGAGVTLAAEGGNLFFSRDDGEIQADFVTGRDAWFTREDIISGVWAQFSGFGMGDIAADPLFAAGWPNVDLRLAAGSPAINAGIADGAPAEDIDRKPRDGQPDIGAYEQ